MLDFELELKIWVPILFDFDSIYGLSCWSILQYAFVIPAIKPVYILKRSMYFHLLVNNHTMAHFDLKTVHAY